MTYIDNKHYQIGNKPELEEEEEFSFRSLRRKPSLKSYIENSSDEEEEIIDSSASEKEESIYFKKIGQKRLNGKGNVNGHSENQAKNSFPVVLKIGVEASELLEMRNLRSRRHQDYDEEDEHEEKEINGNGKVKERGRRRLRGEIKSEDDEDEKDEVEDLDDDDIPSGKEENDDDDYAIIPRRRQSRKSVGSIPPPAPPRKKRIFDLNDEEDEYQEINDDEENEEESDNNIRNDSDDSFETMNNRRLDRGFIVSDEDDSDSLRRKRRRQKLANKAKETRKSHRSRHEHVRQSRRRGGNGDDDDDDDYISEDKNDEEDEDIANLQEELRELAESATPPPEPVRKLQLRERKEVNYQILPPPLPEETFDTVAVSPARNAGNRRRGGGAGPIRRLFPTTGPFGGNDVISVFGGNGLLGGAGGIPGFGGVLGGAGGGSGDPTAIIDSDSSDDELIGNSGTTANNKSKNNATGVSQFGIIKPKKAGTADSDPLGVDMNIDFSAVGGLDNYINQLKEMVTLPLRYPEIYQRFGITPPRGVLFHGPPGTGKTLMARALASSCSTEGKKITFFMRKGADCLSKWVGEAERQLRLLFEEARNQQPSIIFFDEIDGLAPVRSSKQEQIHASIVSTLLALMDGMDNRGEVIVIGATNRPDSVDPALRRPGRFDREFYFPLPDLEARKKIITIHTRKWDPPLQDNFIEHVSELTKGYGGADLRALCTEAALNAIQRRYPQIYMSNDKLLLDPQSINVTPADFMKSVDKIIPSSARSTSSGAAPLPVRIEPLLGDSYKQIVHKLDNLLPSAKKLTALEDSLYEDIVEEDGGFARQEALKSE